MKKPRRQPEPPLETDQEPGAELAAEPEAEAPAATEPPVAAALAPGTRRKISLAAWQTPGGEAGLVCRGCGCRHFLVIYTRAKPDKIMRLRECRHCGKRIRTTEKA